MGFLAMNFRPHTHVTSPNVVFNVSTQTGPVVFPSNQLTGFRFTRVTSQEMIMVVLQNFKPDFVFLWHIDAALHAKQPGLESVLAGSIFPSFLSASKPVTVFGSIADFIPPVHDKAQGWKRHLVGSSQKEGRAPQ